MKTRFTSLVDAVLLRRAEEQSDEVKRHMHRPEMPSMYRPRGTETLLEAAKREAERARIEREAETTRRNARILALLAEGLTAREAAEIVGVGVSTVEHLQRRNPEASPRKQATAEIKKRIFELRREGFSLAQIALQVGLTKPGVFSVIRRAKAQHTEAA